ncbi:hypothetical protein RDWZM_008302 [Blomia tropicalis]|uniref:GPI mannosyltransferase 2 n=1 Tax=Blomia tropicalis TaxID=40697 RepID=A0A9Q0M486_BLOTA|nr:hypothetical protein RDWZM_008302 [Blomia tropicalis]
MNEVVQTCLTSRLLLSLVAITGDLLIPDHEADAYQNDLLEKYYPAGSLSQLDRWVLMLTNAFTRWDGQYFIEIAHENGYPQEQMLAFFPMFPFLIRRLALILQSSMSKILMIKLSFLSSIMITAYLVNLVAFITAGMFLFKLTNLMCNNSRKKTPIKVVRLFAYNPASIFFTAFYTESLYSCLTFCSLYCLYKFRSPLLASIPMSISILTRSNGLVSFGYILFYQIVISCITITNKNSCIRILISFTQIILVTCLSSLICCAAFVYYILIAWEEYCEIVTPSTPKWCNSIIPSPYGSVQTKYWEVGFLRYYQLKKIPNFLMAIPVLTLVFGSKTTRAYEFGYENKYLNAASLRYNKLYC